MEYTIIRSKKRHRSAALLVRDGQIIVQAPIFMPKFIIDRFVREHEPWINKRIKELAAPISPRVQVFSTEQELKQFIEYKLHAYEVKMDLTSSGIIFKHITTYWGSCSPTGKISFNLEMIYAPREAVEYVVVHELAHLKYRGHGVRFWDLVGKFYPKANEMRRILRQIGHDSRKSSL